MHLEKYLESIVKNYDLDETYRYVANFAFSARLTHTTEQPGAIKVGDLNDEARNNFLNLINSEDWNIKDSRSNLPNQTQTRNITLMGFDKGIYQDEFGNYKQKYGLSGLSENYKPIIDFAKDFSHNVGMGELRGLVLVNLPSKCSVGKHFDSGCYYMIRDRYHIVLSADGENNLQVFDEGEYKFKENEIWWYNIKMNHTAFNNSDKDRIHIILDVVPYKNLNIEPLLVKMVHDKINKGFSLNVL